MTRLRVTSRNQLDDTTIESDMRDLLHELNLAAAKGHQFILANEPNGEPVLLETKNITRVRVDRSQDDAFIGGR